MPTQLRFALVLMIVCLTAAAVVTGIYIAAKPNIQKNEQKATDDALRNVLSNAGAIDFQSMPEGAQGKDILYYIGKDANGKVVGYAAEASAQGYSSKPKVMIGVSPDLKTLLRMTVVSQAETPGLGARAEEKKATRTWLSVFGLESLDEKDGESGEIVPWFQEEFFGKPYDGLVVVKTKDKTRIQAITGATITSNAITEASKTAWNNLKKYLPDAGKP